MDWDYIIVGAGSAGCALAYELARTGLNRVLLIESGGSNRSLTIKIPALLGKIDRTCDWGYVSQPDATRGGKAENWTRGHVVGGSSSVNGMIFVRGAPEDFNQWATLGNHGWSYADVLPLFRDLEHSDQTGSSRGHDGQLYVRTLRRVHPLTQAFVDSAVAAGIPFRSDYNAGPQEGISYTQLSQRRGLRCSAADAFLKPLAGKRNFRLQANTHVDRILFKGREAVGVSAKRSGQTENLRGRRIILCAGAVNTPKLLMLSGIGEPSELHRHAIPAVVNNPEVGKNLQEHALVRMLYKTRIPSNNLTEGIGQKLKIGSQYLLHHSGPIAAAIEAVGFIKTSADLPIPDVQLHFVTLGIKSFFDGNESPFLKSPSVTIYVNKSYPGSRGRIALASNNPLDPPKIECTLLAAGSGDLETLIHGVSLVRKILRTEPMRGLIDEEITPGADFMSNETLARYIPPHTESAYHPVGTCRMGSDAAAVVSPDLRVNGVNNLWVADASVMPTLISGNTNAACIMIGMKLGRWFNAGIGGLGAAVV